MFTLAAIIYTKFNRVLKKQIKSKVNRAIRKRDKMWDKQTREGYAQLIDLMHREIEMRDLEIAIYKKQHERDKKMIMKFEDSLRENHLISQKKSETAEYLMQKFIAEVYQPLVAPETKVRKVVDFYNHNVNKVVNVMNMHNDERIAQVI